MNKATIFQGFFRFFDEYEPKEAKSELAKPAILVRKEAYQTDVGKDEKWGQSRHEIAFQQP